eukprot:Gb_08571 [translate_table: standard]
MRGRGFGARERGFATRGRGGRGACFRKSYHDGRANTHKFVKDGVTFLLTPMKEKEEDMEKKTSKVCFVGAKKMLQSVKEDGGIACVLKPSQEETKEVEIPIEVKHILDDYQDILKESPEGLPP